MRFQACKLSGQKLVLPYDVFRRDLFKSANFLGSEFPSRSCKKVKFNPPEKVERKLRIMWPSLTSTPSRAIWRKKFRRHGPCVLTYAESREKTFGYFKEAITLYQRSNILKLLEMKAIRPNNRAPVSLDNMILAIDRDNTLVEFNCEGSQNGSDILHGVKLCFDSPTGKRTICPDALRKKTCKTKKVWYLRDIQYLNEYRKIEKQSKNGKLTNPGQSNVRKDDYDEFNNSDEQNDYEYYYDTYEDRSGYTEQDKSPYTDTVVKPQQIAVPKTFKPEHDKLADKKLYPNWPVETKNHPSQYSSCILAMPSALCVFVATSFALVGLREVTLS